MVLQDLKLRLRNFFQQKTNDISDGYHTFKELYEHRHVLFMLLMAENPKISWISGKHDDGSSYDGWFIAGMDLPEIGMVTYHMPMTYYNRCKEIEGLEELEKAPKWDGHTSQEVYHRLLRFFDYLSDNLKKRRERREARAKKAASSSSTVTTKSNTNQPTKKASSRKPRASSRKTKVTSADKETS